LRGLLKDGLPLLITGIILLRLRVLKVLMLVRLQGCNEVGVVEVLEVGMVVLGVLGLVEVGMIDLGLVVLEWEGLRVLVLVLAEGLVVVEVVDGLEVEDSSLV
jgi:hypothetical protein